MKQNCRGTVAQHARGEIWQVQGPALPCMINLVDISLRTQLECGKLANWKQQVGCGFFVSLIGIDYYLHEDVLDRQGQGSELCYTYT